MRPASHHHHKQIPGVQRKTENVIVVCMICYRKQEWTCKLLWLALIPSLLSCPLKCSLLGPCPRNYPPEATRRQAIIIFSDISRVSYCLQSPKPSDKVAFLFFVTDKETVAQRD